jgi:hypothetical protein
MTNRKKGLAGYDNDQQRRLDDGFAEGAYEKGSSMERGTIHEFAAVGVSDVGAKQLNVADESPGRLDDGVHDPAKAANSPQPGNKTGASGSDRGTFV